MDKVLERKSAILKPEKILNHQGLAPTGILKKKLYMSVLRSYNKVITKQESSLGSKFFFVCDHQRIKIFKKIMESIPWLPILLSIKKDKVT